MVTGRIRTGAAGITAGGTGSYRYTTATGLAGWIRTCDPRLPGPVGWPTPPQPDGIPEIDGVLVGEPGLLPRLLPLGTGCHPLPRDRPAMPSHQHQHPRRDSNPQGLDRPTRFRDGTPRRWQSFQSGPGRRRTRTFPVKSRELCRVLSYGAVVDDVTGRGRTCDAPRFKRALYRLSYGHVDGRTAAQN
jgi:hypothetical protein